MATAQKMRPRRKRRGLWRGQARQFSWRTKEGVRLQLSEMTDEHLANASSYLKSRAQKCLSTAWRMDDELCLRYRLKKASAIEESRKRSIL